MGMQNVRVMESFTLPPRFQMNVGEARQCITGLEPCCRLFLRKQCRNYYGEGVDTVEVPGCSRCYEYRISAKEATASEWSQPMTMQARLIKPTGDHILLPQTLDIRHETIRFNVFPAVFLIFIRFFPFHISVFCSEGYFMYAILSI